MKRRSFHHGGAGEEQEVLPRAGKENDKKAVQSESGGRSGLSS